MRKEKKEEIKQRLEEIEEALRYNEAMLEEIYETQESMFPIFVDVVKLINRLYKELKIDDDELKGCMNRLKETFIDEGGDVIKKYLSKNNDDFSIAYT
ncbi:MAG: hypothetical protein FE041_04185 [Thermoplasmata archaeon]|nr:MAG: hypothetical protein FE041_04185 [Thermoplasmata archaeon]